MTLYQTYLFDDNLIIILYPVQQKLLEISTLANSFQYKYENSIPCLGQFRVHDIYFAYHPVLAEEKLIHKTYYSPTFDKLKLTPHEM